MLIAEDLKTAIDGKASIPHTHDISNVTNLQTTLNSKLDKGTYTGNAQDLKTDIDGKASISHTHDISNVTNLQTSLNSKLDKGTYDGTAQDLKNSIDNLQIGGRNLIKDSKKYSDSQKAYWIIFELAEKIVGTYTIQIWMEDKTPNGAVS